MTYQGPERRKYVQLSNEDFERLAHRAKELAKQEIFIEVGQTSIKAFFFWLRWILLSVLAAASAWLAAHGFLSK